MALGLGIVVYWATQSGPAATIVSAFKSRVIADGGTVESPSCAKSAVKFLLNNPVPSAFTGLLNDYSGAAAAYSLRLLDNTYTGDAIVVRRSSDNTTQNIGFVNNELDTASLESFCSGTDGFVTTWYDQSGNGNDAAQATASSQPKIVSAGSTILDNGKPAVYFNGNHYIENSNIFNEPTISIVSIHNNYSTASSRRNFGLRGDIGISRSTFAQDSDNSLRYDGAFTAGTLTASISQKVRYSQRQTNHAYDYINGVENINSVEALPNIIAQPSIGGVMANLGSPYVGTFQEGIIWFSDELTNRTGIETNINSYYSIY